ncbi:MAG: hypothetical protein J6X50_01050 [Bacilli bacterium]|nr:hypothetical protein [Bacilli bacterium]
MSETAIIVLEVVVISLTVIFLLTIIGNYIRKKIKGLPTGECACCHKSTKKMLKEYHKCCCNKK